MRLKKYKKLIALLLSLNFALVSFKPQVILAEETGEEVRDLSPNSQEQEDVDVNPSEEEGATSSQQQPSDPHYVELINSLSVDKPVSIVEALKAEPKRRTSDITKLKKISADEYILQQRGIVKDEGKYIIVERNAKDVPYKVILQEEDGVVTRALTPVPDIFNYAAEALNSTPELYEGTAVEDVYVLGQTKYEELADSVIEEDPSEYESLVTESEALSELTLEVLGEWLLERNVIDSGSELEDQPGLYEYVMGEGTRESFNSLFSEKLKNYEELSWLEELFPNYYEGIVTIDYPTGTLGLILLEESGNALEFIMSLSDIKLSIPENSNFIQQADLDNELGMSYKDAYKELADQIGIQTVILQEERAESEEENTEAEGSVEEGEDGEDSQG